MLRAVHGDRDRIAGTEIVFAGEGLKKQHLIAMRRINHPALGEIDPVDRRRSVRIERNDLGADRRGDLRQIDQPAALRSAFNVSDAVKRANVRKEVVRRAFYRGVNVGEAIALVIGAHGLFERQDHPARHHQKRDARRDDENDRQSLTLDAPEVAHQFAVEGGEMKWRFLHQLISSAEILCSLTTTSRI